MTSCRRALLLLAAAVAAHGCNRGPPFAEPPPAGVDAGIARGEELYLRGEFDSARAIWQSSLGAAGPRDSAAEPRILTLLGLAAYRQGEYDEARRLGEQALSLKLARNLRRELPKSYGALGLLAWTEGRLVFRNTPLREVAVQLGRWYALDVRVNDPALGRLLFTGSFRNESVAEVLHSLELALDLRARRQGERVTLSANGARPSR